MNSIEVDRVSKRYLLGENRPGRSVRDTIALSVGGLRKIGRGHEVDEIWSLRDVSLSVADGEALGVIGRNGAGKSTLLKILSRITEPTRGVSRTRGRVTSLLEVGTGFHPELTGRENVFLNGAILGMSRKDIARRFDEIVAFAGVERFIGTPVKRYSTGMHLRLAFSVAAHLEPDVMVVDEVLAVGDAEFQAKCLGRMESVEQEGRTVVFVSHNLEAITRLCSRAIWLDGGEIMADGSSVDVVEAYIAGAVGRAAAEGVASQDPTAAVALQGVRVVDATGKSGGVFRRDQSISIELRFLVRTPVPGFDLAASIVNGRGIEVLNEAWSDTASKRSTGAGEYIAWLEIPPILNAGDYIVGVWFGSRYDTIFHETTVARFRLEGDLKNRPARGVVLDLPWSVHRSEGAVAADLGATGDDLGASA
jgi:ABC-2 type transport system ATP-binding protein/lipopolysaccharide transport system ATP-binding protein